MRCKVWPTRHYVMANVLDLADAILHAALAADADRVWIDPVPLAEACYMITVERRAKVISTATLDEDLARARDRAASR